jgi:TRAP-type C4-dicarboxylate transport system substrate-binding protein
MPRWARSSAQVVVAAVVTLAALLLVTSCDVAADRSGGQRAADPVTLRGVNVQDGLETPPYVEAVHRLSEGSIRFRVQDKWHLDDLSAEQDAIRMVSDGHADVAFVPARAFGGLGYHSFDALIAPFVVNSYAAQREVLVGAIGRDMLASASLDGITALAILPGPLRRPVGITTTLLGPDDYRGKLIGISPSPVAARFFAELGAHTAGSPFQRRPITSYDGIEQQVSSVQGNRYDAVASSITANIALWPRPVVVIAHTRRLHRLSAQQREALVLAGQTSFVQTLSLQRSNESESTAALCRGGTLRLLDATPDQLAALHAAAQPVLTWLERDPQTRAYLSRIEAARQRMAVEWAEEPTPTCEGFAPAGDESRPQRRGQLDGTWTMHETAEDVTAQGAPDEDVQAPENSGDWVFVVDRGRFAFTQRNGPACTWGYGTWDVTGDQVEWRFVDGGGIAPTGAANKPGELFDYHWSLYRDTLTLRPVPGAVAPENFFGKPWRRVDTKPDPSRFFTRCGLPDVGVP